MKRKIFGFAAARTPHTKRFYSVSGNPSDPKGIEVANMISVKMSQKHLIKIIIWNFHSREFPRPNHRGFGHWKQGRGQGGFGGKRPYFGFDDLQQ